MVAVTPQSVRERINLTESTVSDDVVNRFIADAAERALITVRGYENLKEQRRAKAFTFIHTYWFLREH